LGNTEINWIDGSGVTAPEGFRAGAVHAGVKKHGSGPRLDLAILASDRACSAAGLFTRNAVCGAPVVVTRERVAGGRARALIANSGCSNVGLGARGDRDARRMTELAAARLSLPVEEVLVASTGVIGRPLPMDLIEAAVPRLELTREGGADFARAIMTTDTVPKSRALRFGVGGRTYTIGGTAKGAGMAHPDLATVFCFLTTDAPAEARWLRKTLREAADVSLIMIDVDMDTSTSDTMLLFANGAAGGKALRARHPAAGAFGQALRALTVELAKDLARDGEGAQTLIEVKVEGAATRKDARAAARTVASSPLVKTMVAGRDPNLGRVLAAVGRSGAKVEVARISIHIGGHRAFENGVATELDLDAVSSAMNAEQVRFLIDLGLGKQSATAWGCDLTEGYVRINADYTT
jgi:glutamate N-acetyltransferase/amino-acid N-acetyltransferase